MKIRVAFTIIGGKAWLGGYNYALNLVATLVEKAGDRIEPVVFAGNDLDADDLAPFQRILGVEPLRDPVFDYRPNQRQILLRLVGGTDPRVERLFRQQRIDVAFESAVFYGWRFPFPCIAWIPDFQHRDMPQMFSRGAFWRREIGLRLQMLSERTIMLSSETARRDLERFYGGEAFVVPFAVRLPARPGEEELQKLLVKYSLPSKFFYLPNQFWKHKNHALAIEALAVMRRRGVDVVIACSGNVRDPRHPGLFESLMSHAENLGVKDLFRYLGVIPYADVAGLLRQAIAVVNPSLLEGWSTTVEEAKAIGAELVLSDISVHREQAVHASFFDPRSPEGMAQALLEVANKGLGGVSVDREQRAANEYLARQQEFADAFVRVAEHASRRLRA